MNAVIPFEFEGSAVRVLDREGSPWFVLADVCRVLEIGNPSQAASRLDDDEKTTLINNEGRAGCGAQEFTIISESGLYSLVLTSRKAAAKRFKKWVTAEVLPSIRRTGAYFLSAPPAPFDAANPWDQPLAVINTQLRVIARVEKVYGPGAARALWRQSALPQVEDDAEPGAEVFDANGCLAHLMRFATINHATVGDLIDAALDGAGDDLLVELGILVRNTGGANMIAVAESGSALSMIYRNTVWRDGGWSLGLAGLPGARRSLGLMFGGRKRRAVLIPLSHVNSVARFRAA